MKKIDLKLVILTIIFIVILVALVFVFSKEKENSDLQNSEQYLILNNSYSLISDNLEWKSVSFTQMGRNINWTKCRVYSPNREYQLYDIVTNGDRYYYFDDDRVSHELIDDSLILNNDTYFRLVDYDNKSLTDNDTNIINKVLDKYELSKNISITKKYDLDNNSSVYIISNYGLNDTYFYLVFLRNKFKNYEILLNNYDNNFDIDLDLMYVLDVNKDLYSFVLTGVAYEGKSYFMFDYSNRVYNKIFES